MTDNPDYRLYLEEKFGGLTKHIHAQFENVHETLGAIKEQTTKTNGRITELESQLTELDKAFTIHPVNCNSAQEIKDIKKDLEEYRIIKKYPKVALLVIAFFVLTTAISIYQAVKASQQLVKTEQSIKNSIGDMEGASKTK